MEAYNDKYDKKVLYISPLPPPTGGIATWTKRIVEIGLPGGWGLDVINSNKINNDKIFGTKINLLNEFKRARIITKSLKKSLQDEKYKVIHINTAASAKGMIRDYLCASISKKRKRKVVIHFHCTLSNFIKTKFEFFILRKLISVCDEIIVLNNPSKNFIFKHFNRDSVIIANFISKKFLNIVKEKNISDDIKTAVYVGGVTEDKGCVTIIETAAYLKDVTFKFIGELTEPVSKIKIPENVVFTGNISNDDVIEELKKSDIFLFLSFFPREGFSNALLEAMSVGLPCIATDWAAAADMIEDKGGILVPVKETAPVVEAINKLRDPVLRKKMSEWNIKKVTDSYSSDIIFNKYIEIYDKLIQ